jgi:hypothetical protein
MIAGSYFKFLYAHVPKNRVLILKYKLFKRKLDLKEKEVDYLNFPIISSFNWIWRLNIMNT